jgi:uncharacterized protein YndB with AHSA1/START domain
MTETAIQISAPITRVAPDAIRLERLLDAPVETVWRYLTEAELREQWFMGGTDATGVGAFDLVVDHDKLSTDKVPYPEANACYKGSVWHEKVLQFDPPRLLETTFQGGENGIVAYELKSEGEKTRLILTHRGITTDTGFTGFGGGWNSHMTVLQEKLAGRSVRDFWALHARSNAAVKEALGM